jgi:hypothetical protein
MKSLRSITYILHWNGWNHKKASHISCSEMNETTKKTSHISCTEMNETTKKHHLYFALKWIKSHIYIYLALKWMKPKRSITYILHWNEWNHQKNITYILHKNGWNPKEASHIFDIKYLTLKCVKPQKAPHISCIEMHDTTRFTCVMKQGLLP